MSTWSDASTAVHEAGHWLEYFNSGIHQKALDFLQRRTAGESAITMNKATGSRGYRANEKTRPDEFLDPYMGKDYGTRATEIVSMGLEYFYEKSLELARDDPEYFDFIFDLVRGR